MNTPIDTLLDQLFENSPDEMHDHIENQLNLVFAFRKEMRSCIEEQLATIMAQDKIAANARLKAIDADNDVKNYSRYIYFTRTPQLVDNRIRYLTSLIQKNTTHTAKSGDPGWEQHEKDIQEMLKNQALMALLNEKVSAVRERTQERANYRKKVNAYHTNIPAEICKIALKYRAQINPTDFNRVYKTFIKEYHLSKGLRNIIVIRRQEPTTTTTKASSTTEPQECAICYSTYKKQQTVTLNCNHEFCNKCIEQFTNITDRACSCPMCRAPVTEMRTYNKTLVNKILKHNNSRNTFITNDTAAI